MSREVVERQVSQVLVEMFELAAEDVVATAHLYEDLDLDSLDAIDLVVKLKTETGIKLTEQEMKSIRTVADIVDVVFASLEASGSVAPS